MPEDASIPELIEYTGEFGPELELFLPYVRWLARNGLLSGRTVRTYAGMAPFYEGLGIEVFEEKTEKREWLSPCRRPKWLPRRNEHTFDGLGRPQEHDYGDMRSQFAQFPVSRRVNAAIALKPLLVIHNKYNDEWGMGPVNFFDSASLHYMFSALKSHFTVLYVNHDRSRYLDGFSDDHNSGVSGLGDGVVLRRHPEVLSFDDDYNEQKRAGGDDSINRYKMAIYARCRHFITVQGGGAAQIATLKGSLIVVLHRQGLEEGYEYSPGPYSFMADPPPTLLVCTSQREVLATLPALGRSIETGGRIALAPHDKDLTQRLSPSSLPARSRWVKRWVRLRALVRKHLPRTDETVSRPA